ncbi:hypothetical protein HUO09_17005 [Vibrio sp. Y2-5]|uniref:hypothetical protein n=1 Tax=Vibrio sp. Y2-5 TaxID=2743977 RepID=UPI0016616F4D|nr:hypothetical protein [Vibrio sp. Y2-5]MBD0788055.1 hypothetical protein [Vibrio sp. Y2-5]
MNISSPIPVMVSNESFKLLSGQKVVIEFDGYIWVGATDGSYLYVLSLDLEGQLVPRIYKNLDEARAKVDLDIALEDVEMVEGNLFDTTLIIPSNSLLREKHVIH